MKKLMGYTIIIFVVIIFLPLVIVKGGSGKLPPPSTGSDDKISDDIQIKKEQNDAINKSEEGIICIDVYNHLKKKTEKMPLEEYIKGVVAAEMPADFEIEALKAQAVAARTFAYGRLNGTYRSKEGVHDGVPICTDPTHCQAWVSKEDARKKWSFLTASRNWRKIEKAVEATKGIIMEYEGKAINALFHANSGGRTENCNEVWEGVYVPYLQSVVSRGEEGTRGYEDTVKIKIDDFIKKLKSRYPDINFKAKDIPGCIKILDYTSGGRVNNIKIANVTMKGTEFRSLFGLKSANFKIKKADEKTLSITTRGYGHGVGMSQCGANYLASRGGVYTEILKYYYVGIDLVKIS